MESDPKITIDQINYAENLKTVNYIHNKTDTKDLLQFHIGKLLWMSSQTIPDIAFNVCQLGTNFKNSGEQDVKYTNKVIQHSKQNPDQIIYKQLGCVSWKLTRWWKSIRLFSIVSWRK